MNEIQRKLATYKSIPENTGIISDFDGTLSEIAPKPDKACISLEMRTALEKLSKIYGVVAVVTGRDAINARNLIGLDNIIYVGNHGLERANDESLTPISEAEKYTVTAGDIALDLSRLSLLDGIAVEKKRFGVAIHYRLAKNKKEAYRQVKDTVDSIASKYSMRIDEGRNVVELKPDLIYNKGFAVKDLARENKLNHVLYIGDDITDVDAFKEMKYMRQEGWIDTICIAVSSNEINPLVIQEADYIVDGVDSVRMLLEWMSEDVSKVDR